MVRKGSSVRVRQRAWGKVLQTDALSLMRPACGGAIGVLWKRYGSLTERLAGAVVAQALVQHRLLCEVRRYLTLVADGKAFRIY
jgi:hypothetical protein